MLAGHARPSRSTARRSTRRRHGGLRARPVAERAARPRTEPARRSSPSGAKPGEAYEPLPWEDNPEAIPLFGTRRVRRGEEADRWRRSSETRTRAGFSTTSPAPRRGSARRRRRSSTSRARSSSSRASPSTRRPTTTSRRSARDPRFPAAMSERTRSPRLDELERLPVDDEGLRVAADPPPLRHHGVRRRTRYTAAEGRRPRARGAHRARTGHEELYFVVSRARDVHARTTTSIDAPGRHARLRPPRHASRRDRGRGRDDGARRRRAARRAFEPSVVGGVLRGVRAARARRPRARPRELMRRGGRSQSRTTWQCTTTSPASRRSTGGRDEALDDARAGGRARARRGRRSTPRTTRTSTRSATTPVPELRSRRGAGARRARRAARRPRVDLRLRHDQHGAVALADERLDEQLQADRERERLVRLLAAERDDVLLGRARPARTSP